jgi:hypothetical protein
MVDSIKTLVKSLFQFIKNCNFFARKIDSSKRNTTEIEPHFDPPIYVYNKFGVIEHISDQCDNRTCTCKENCQVDDMIFYESMLLDEYKRKMRESQKRDNGA